MPLANWTENVPLINPLWTSFRSVVRVRESSIRCSSCARPCVCATPDFLSCRMGDEKPPNAMRELTVEKLVLNICVGTSGDPLEKARRVLKQLTGLDGSEGQEPVFSKGESPALSAPLPAPRHAPAAAAPVCRRGLEASVRHLVGGHAERRGSGAGAARGGCRRLRHSLSPPQRIV